MKQKLKKDDLVQYADRSLYIFESTRKKKKRKCDFTEKYHQPHVICSDTLMYGSDYLSCNRLLIHLIEILHRTLMHALKRYPATASFAYQRNTYAFEKLFSSIFYLLCVAIRLIAPLRKSGNGFFSHRTFMPYHVRDHMHGEYYS